ncbi:MAG TPA: hypothetical protein PLC76_02425 [Saprospiraceae bacterium]|nr:hypothetical protein [Candidatus Parvibacillus calidus]MBX2936674.1 hypothetical protein [Saprospiraceae bacterium]MBX7180020.1 hypothetical protein [Saprospiraceae bacterium]MCB0591019.1 hypothetical protein [Saprospiraceae bacterium]MCC7147890.1 hypothetical protein [Saprospiraceae bacterium]
MPQYDYHASINYTTETRLLIEDYPLAYLRVGRPPDAQNRYSSKNHLRTDGA